MSLPSVYREWPLGYENENKNNTLHLVLIRSIYFHPIFTRFSRYELCWEQMTFDLHEKQSASLSSSIEFEIDTSFPTWHITHSLPVRHHTHTHTHARNHGCKSCDYSSKIRKNIGFGNIFSHHLLFWIIVGKSEFFKMSRHYFCDMIRKLSVLTLFLKTVIQTNRHWTLKSGDSLGGEGQWRS